MIVYDHGSLIKMQAKHGIQLMQEVIIILSRS